MSKSALHAQGEMSNVPCVTFTRLLPGPIERVWSYLTDPKKLPTWYGEVALDRAASGRQGPAGRWSHSWHRHAVAAAAQARLHLECVRCGRRRGRGLRVSGVLSNVRARIARHGRATDLQALPHPGSLHSPERNGLAHHARHADAPRSTISRSRRAPNMSQKTRRSTAST